jgi:hypothetical protein
VDNHGFWGDPVSNFFSFHGATSQDANERNLRVYEEYENTGAGSTTTARLYETKATAAVTYSQLWGTSGWENNGF